MVFHSAHLCLVLFQVPKCFVPLQIFWASPKIYLHIVDVTKILCQTNSWFALIAFSKIGFCAGTKVFEEALNAVKFLGWLKKFGPAQNILGPVKRTRHYSVELTFIYYRKKCSSCRLRSGCSCRCLSCSCSWIVRVSLINNKPTWNFFSKKSKNRKIIFLKKIN